MLASGGVDNLIIWSLTTFECPILRHFQWQGNSLTAAGPNSLMGVAAGSGQSANHLHDDLPKAVVQELNWSSD